ncbi:ATP-dependent DNA helicase PIF1-like [Vigna unguiculata]|uniref:ATP-dependent DNA helicase PIF1-like n=1 Tax=Vigna unguiculata TaxID=3917 RepID=UPI001015FEF9|nr:ATP-dependent DNA helicase PIF1-like [Vigna unguiculata]
MSLSEVQKQSQNVSQVTPEKENWNIIVRVIRSWFVPDFTKQRCPFSMELVIQDKEGSKIHASIRRTLIYIFQTEISEGHVYAIQNFSVAPNSGIYRTTHHPYKINFQFGTKVSLLHGNLVPDLKPQYTPLSLLTTTRFDTDYLVDILGLLVGVGTERELQVNGKTTKLNVIAIEADGMCFEAFDRTLRDIMRNVDDANNDKPFGGKAVVLGGDFRQILPVIKKGSRFDIIKSAINYSELWNCCKVLKLSKNMRLSTTTNNQTTNDIKEFADWILKIGDGQMDANENGECMVEIPEELLIINTDLPLLSLVEFVYPQFVVNMTKPNYFDNGAILCPTNDFVEHVNDFMLSLLGGEEVTYLSSDTPCQSDEQDEVQFEWFTSEFLNDIKCSGIPNHKLKLKTGVPIMLLRNIDQAKGLCNGTRLQVNRLGKNVISATVITGKNIGDKIFIPRMDLVSSDSGLPFKFQRRQFPVSLCFAMTINKSQGQTLSKVGLYLPQPVFTHGQLYVAISRVKTKRGLKILILDEDGNVTNTTKNVVYKEIFETL